MDVLAGRMWIAGGNANNANQPNFVDFANQVGITFYPSTATNVVAAATQAVPITQYDPAGAGVVTSIPVPLTQAVIHRLFYLAGQYILCYGQTLYPDLPTAIQSINNDNATFKPPPKLTGATLFAYLCATGNCTNLNDGIGGRIVGANAVSATSGGGAGVSEAPLDGNCYARLNGAWWRSIFIDPNYNGMLGNNARATPLTFSLNAAAGQTRQLNFQSSGLNRFSIIVDNTAEPGSNAGSNITFNRYADNGAYLDTPLAIARNTGLVTLGNVSILGTTSCGGAVSITMPAAGNALTITNTYSGAAIKLVGDGATTPSKLIRARAGNLEFVNDANSVIIATLSDAGGFNCQALNVTSASTNSTGITVVNTSSNHTWTVGVGGSGGVANAPAGSYVFYDNTAPGLRGWFDPGGNFTVAGTVSSSQSFQSTGAAAILGATGAGTCYLRPNGINSGVGQAYVNSNGQWTVTTSGSNATLNVVDVGGNGSNICLQGNGGSAPNKYLRAANGNLQVVTHGYSAVVISIADYGTACGLSLTGGFYPGSDNAWPIGQASTRFTAIYAVNGAIQTSDAREKTTVKRLTDAELKAAKQLAELIGTYQWLESIKEKGANKARLHFGLTAQAAIKVMEANGLDPFAYGFLCYDKWDEFKSDHIPEVKDEDGNITQAEEPHVTPAGDRYSMRYDELAMFIARGEHERLKAIEALLNI
jgi:hypothetical protein